jgi:hypothetical protein
MPQSVVSGSYSYFSAFVLSGYPGASGPSIPGDKNNDTFAGNPCNTAWQADAETGATLYMGGDSSMTIEESAVRSRSQAGTGVRTTSRFRPWNKTPCGRAP